MREYDRTGNGQNGEADWDLRSILCDMAKNWWIILLICLLYTSDAADD